MLLRATLEPPADVIEELRLVEGNLAGAGLHAVPPGRLEVVLARFGNVTTDVAERLALALDVGLVGMSACALALTGPRVDERAVVADLVGELDLLRDLAGAVARIAQAHRIYVDRRVFRTGVVLGEIDVAAPGAPPALRVERMEHWSSSPWAASEVSLIRTTWRGRESVAEHWYGIPLS